MQLQLTPLGDLPLIHAGDDLGELILKSLDSNSVALEDGDIVVIGQKIVSKAEGRTVDLDSVTPSGRARELARVSGKDMRLVELMLRESQSVLRVREGTIIVLHRLGFVCANAGIDHSNVGPSASASSDYVLLLPKSPDDSAARIRGTLEARSGHRIGVIINDSHGRAWRLGTVGVAIGMSGVPALIDARGWTDLFGYSLKSTIIGVADELAAAASLVMGQAAEGIPAVHVRGFPYPLREGTLADLIRPEEQDLFR